MPIPQAQYISSQNDERIRVFSSLRDKTLKSSRHIIADSPKVVLRMMKSGYPIRKLLASESFLEENMGLFSEEKGDIFYAPKNILESIVGHRLHHGVIAISDRPENCSLDQLGQKILVLDGVNKAENVGVILRNCDCFGIDSVIANTATGLSPYIRRSIRVSMGSIFNLKIRESCDLTSDLRYLKGKGFAIYGSGNYETPIVSRNLIFPKRAVMVMGSEGFGMSPEVMRLVDATVRIPIRDHVDSLNVSAAASILLYLMSDHDD